MKSPQSHLPTLVGFILLLRKTMNEKVILDQSWILEPHLPLKINSKLKIFEPIALGKMAWTNLVWRVPGLMHLGSIKAGAKMYYRARVRMLPSILLRSLEN